MYQGMTARKNLGGLGVFSRMVEGRLWKPHLKWPVGPFSIWPRMYGTLIKLTGSTCCAWAAVYHGSGMRYCCAAI